MYFSGHFRNDSYIILKKAECRFDPFCFVFRVILAAISRNELRGGWKGEHFTVLSLSKGNWEGSAAGP